ncbi:uncharacterized protein LOC116617399 isoform X3 [Nematostella vectensis]|uniref:uncharacterized protein LOC116617399 isoform X3 n=1 Tax=Nematostella vectensis TaxID=45351 RepID=UPI00207728A9|nr:uncharacterized protein LOC116617399 isoform X3 [Nematostella vectensis]
MRLALHSSTKVRLALLSSTKVRLALHLSTKVRLALHSSTKVRLKSLLRTKVRLALISSTKVRLALHSSTKVRLALHSSTKVRLALLSSTKVRLALLSSTKVRLPLHSSTKARLPLLSSTKVRLALLTSTKVRLALHSSTKVRLALHSSTKVRLALHSSTKVRLALHSSTKVRLALLSSTKVRLPLLSSTKVRLALHSSTKVRLTSLSSTKVRLALLSSTKVRLKLHSSTKVRLALLSSTKVRLALHSSTKVRLALHSSTKVRLTSLSSTKVRLALLSSTKVRLALLSSTKVRLALFSSTKVRLALHSSTKVRLALLSSTKVRLALLSSTKVRLTLHSSTKVRLALHSSTKVRLALHSSTKVRLALHSSTKVRLALHSSTKVYRLSLEKCVLVVMIFPLTDSMLISDKALVNHVIAEHDVTELLDCVFACLSAEQCFSLNFRDEHGACELNNVTALNALSSDLIPDLGSKYYDGADYVLPVCASSPCINGGTCTESCDGTVYECACANTFAGENCQTWIGYNGSSSETPGRSCLTIKLNGNSRDDGIYWIQPTPAVEPFTVYCDMTTDGGLLGGWTAIKKLEITSTPVSTDLLTTENYRTISDIQNIAYLLEAPGMLSLKRDMGFDQMRFYCYKGSVGRVVHIMTKREGLGFDVIRYLIENPVPHPPACNSFTRLSDDTSVLSRRCAEWGNLCNGATNCDQWGNTAFDGPWRTAHRQAYFTNRATGETHTIGFSVQHLFCDDNSNSVGVGDKFMIFVR